MKHLITPHATLPSLLPLLGLVGLLGACDEPPPRPTAAPTGSPAPATRGLAARSFCVSDACSYCEERELERSRTCSRCVSFCAGAILPDCFAQCTSLCSPKEDCDVVCDEANTCYAYQYSFQAYGEPDPELQASCVRALTHQMTCGVALADPATECQRFATLEDPSSAAAYDCMTALPCGASDADALACMPPPRHGLADWYCQASADRGRANCDPSIRARLANADGFMFASTARALETCTSSDADDLGIDLDDCVLAWLEAVEPAQPTGP